MVLGNPEKSEVKVNVTAYGPIEGTGGSFYDGEMLFNGITHSLSDEIASPGFFKRLEDLAGVIGKRLEEETKSFTAGEMDDIIIAYHSDTAKDHIWGSRGYTASHGSYSRRSLHDSEMNILIREVDRKVRPIFYRLR